MSLKSTFESLGLKEACTPNTPLPKSFSLEKKESNFPSLNDFHDACPEIPKINVIQKSIDTNFDSFIGEWGSFIENTFHPFLELLVWTEGLFVNTPWWLMLAILCAVTYGFSRNKVLTISVAIGMSVIGVLGMWNETMQTISFIFICTFICVLVGIPIGISMTYNKTVQRIVSPVLDILQTLPSFVYLIPVVMLFGVGKIPGAIAVIFYAVAPVIRLTELGINQVDKDILEASDAFGVNRWQKLFQVQIPLAMPNIMLGINQTIMMSLAMVVIASMVGVRGLGLDVLEAVTNQYLAKGIFSGMAVVLVAIAIDRVTSSSIKENKKTG
jgi:glycine betaine/proline transport system permease protein